MQETVLAQNNYLPESERWICENCFEGAIDVGEPIKGFHLVYVDGAFYLMDSGTQGHKETECMVFPKKPTPYPLSKFEENSLDDDDEKWNEVDNWVETWDVPQLWRFDLPVAHKFYNGCMKAGYVPEHDMAVHLWVVDRIGHMIAIFENWLEEQE